MQTQYIKTNLGVWKALWSVRGLYALNFPQQADGEASVASDEAQTELARQLEAYCAGKDYNCAAIIVDFSGYTDFAVEVLKACQQIGHGQTDTYKNLAVQVGRDKAYRAVGNIMSNNRTPLIIPCHRVLGSTGKLCGFAGGLLMKRSLLELEAQK